ncbi:DUF4229 domain-containing protein [Paenibacillus lemnae]|uniref:DUF4229 domain-containing protein n=1 Tax=Paenibacillus lemnae TaxID=1330551 RepID=A0A848M2L4_PAELE|nr:DUF4229 domain-containing protein [Paenibacillus lemnae]NMO94509.1 DUF4229 domain-containing protein [Paenibacillus lemnae]
MSTAIHEQRQPKMQPFYWILTFESIIIAMVIGLALIIGPFILLSLWPSPWMWLTLLAIPVGLLMSFMLFRNLRQRIWLNRHNDRFAIYDDHVEYTVWDKETKESRQESVPIRDIKEMYYGRHVMMYSYAYKETKFRERAPMAELWPVLHLVYRGGAGDRLLTVPFGQPDEANQWLNVLFPKGIQMWLSNIVIQNPDDPYAIDILREEENRVSAEFDGNVERQFRPYMDAQIEQERAQEHSRELTPEEEEILDDEIRQIEEMEKTRREKAVFVNIGSLAWMVFLLQFGLGWWIIRLAAECSIELDSFVIPGLILLGISMLFFLLVKRLRWQHMLVFWGASFLTWLVLDIAAGSEEEGSVLYEAGGALMGTSMLAPLGIWLTFLLGSFIRRRKDADRQEEARSKSQAEGSAAEETRNL